MGAKTWMLVIADTNAREALARKPTLDRDATRTMAGTLFPDDKLTPLGDGDLSRTCPPKNEVYVGCFPGVTVIAAKEIGIDCPSKLHPRFLKAAGDRAVTLHAMHSVVDWFAYAIWEHGKLVRSLSVSPDSGIMEDIGQRLAFEEPYWSGKHPVGVDEDADAYPLPFHPLELGEAALMDRFGYQLEGDIVATLLEPATIPLVRFQRTRSAWWKFW